MITTHIDKQQSAASQQKNLLLFGQCSIFNAELDTALLEKAFSAWPSHSMLTRLSFPNLNVYIANQDSDPAFDPIPLLYYFDFLALPLQTQAMLLKVGYALQVTRIDAHVVVLLARVINAANSCFEGQYSPSITLQASLILMEFIMAIASLDIFDDPSPRH